MAFRSVVVAILLVFFHVLLKKYILVNTFVVGNIFLTDHALRSTCI